MGEREESRGQDRRKYHRIGTEQVISYAELDAVDHRAVGRDLSQGGIRFEAIGCEIDPGQVIRVTFHVGPETVTATGRVAWATEIDPLTTDVGLEFLEVDPRVVEQIESVIGAPEIEI